MKALVTGGGGFLGSHIVKLLLKEGHEVHVIARGSYPKLEAMGVHCHKADLANKASLIQPLKNIESVFHVAALAGIWGDWEDYYNSNVLGTKNLLEVSKQQGIQKFVYTSSPSVVFDGSNMENVTEEVSYPSEYKTHYPKSKAMAEKMVISANSDEFLTCSLRPHLIWGPGDNHLIPRFLKRAKAGALKIVGDGSNLVDTSYVYDCARAHILAEKSLNKGSISCGQSYFISQGEPVSLFDWINSFVEASGQQKVRSKVPAKLAYQLGAVMEFFYSLLRIKSEPRMTKFLASELSTSHYFDISKAKNHFGYVPKYSMEKAFDELKSSSYFKELCQSLGLLKD
ncbi:MAG: NAD-dependent epimerase/dehydratase family protein [Candidatus Cloacimonetes bacterium]|nr:NAD-dependent epimerase/dehydratase family protein [Candidatus Cloacimonadota bacterium]